jgi:FMN phosphatase YigB (HAD superfamily)
LASILFFDDTMENIEGARAAGLKAIQVKEPSDVSRALARSSIVT